MKEKRKLKSWSYVKETTSEDQSKIGCIISPAALLDSPNCHVNGVVEIVVVDKELGDERSPRDLFPHLLFGVVIGEEWQFIIRILDVDSENSWQRMESL